MRGGLTGVVSGPFSLPGKPVTAIDRAPAECKAGAVHFVSDCPRLSSGCQPVSATGSATENGRSPGPGRSGSLSDCARSAVEGKDRQGVEGPAARRATADRCRRSPSGSGRNAASRPGPSAAGPRPCSGACRRSSAGHERRASGPGRPAWRSRPLSGRGRRSGPGRPGRRRRGVAPGAGGIGSPRRRASAWSAASLSASQARRSSARSARMTTPLPSRFFSSAASSSTWGIGPSSRSWATVRLASSFFRSPVRTSVL